MVGLHLYRMAERSAQRAAVVCEQTFDSAVVHP